MVRDLKKLNKIKEGLMLQKRTNGRPRLIYKKKVLPHLAAKLLMILMEDFNKPKGSMYLIKRMWGEDHYYDSHSRNVFRIHLFRARQFLKEIDGDVEIVRDVNFKIKVKSKEDAS